MDKYIVKVSTFLSHSFSLRIVPYFLLSLPRSLYRYKYELDNIEIISAG